jgi:hypothetical protein
MAVLRGGQKIWTSVSIAAGAKSAFAIPGPGPYVAVYVKNEDASVDGVELTVEVAVSDKVQAGRNALDATTDGGLNWFKYTKDGTTALKVTVAHGTTAMIDLSPFAPQFVRLHRTDAGAAAVVTAWVSAFGQS